MTLDEFRERCVSAAEEHFARADLRIRTRRGTVFEARVQIDEETFVAVYFNALTGKTSYTLISGGQGVMGYNNYRFWHHHPLGCPQEHVPCEEPAIEDLFAEMREAISATGTENTSQFGRS